MVDKHRIERELMELMIGPDRAAILTPEVRSRSGLSPIGANLGYLTKFRHTRT